MPPSLLPHLLEERLALHGHRLAIHDGNQGLNWQQVDHRCRCMAAGLRELGVKAGDRVAIWLDKGVEQSLAFLAVHLAGGISVVVNEILHFSQVSHILTDCGITTLILDGKRLHQHGASLTPLGVQAALVLGETAQFLSGLPRLLQESSLSPWLGTITGIGEDPSHIIYTSGSTGLPKGIVVSHRNALDGARIVSSYTGLGSDEVILGVLPLSFDYGLNQWLNALYTGSTYRIHRFLFPNDLLSLMEKEKVTVLAGMPTLWSRLLDPSLTDWSRSWDLSSVRVVTNSGGRVPVAAVSRLVERFSKARVYLMYGLTEAFRSTYLPPEEIQQRPNSMGKAIPEVDIQVVREDGSPCDVGEVGELIHRGALITMGYWNNPEKTAQVFRANPALGVTNSHLQRVVYSGDLVWRDAEGFLYYQGRRDQLIKTKGYRVSPEEVEALLTSLPGILAAAVIPCQLPQEEIGVRAFVRLSEGEDGSWIRRACQQRAPFYLVPDSVVVVESFPLTANGKIDRAQLASE
ncbi:MAG: AMP-binding protein [Magnetococcales bacterium]|nr:AMP-binding protein [Magnetococcales bacterium]NGZ27686.1 AMP-binding protein [Magnetococcales bacterium]